MRGATLLVLAGVLVIATACGSSDRPATEGTPSPQTPLTDTTWVLTAIGSGTNQVNVPQRVRATLHLHGGQAAMNTGCNSGGGSFRVQGDEIVLGPLVSTMMACLGDRGSVEQKVRAVLTDGAVRWSVSGDRLTLSRAGRTLEYVARP